MPEKCRELMTSEASSIIDFYPRDFAVDLNGKRYMWQVRERGGRFSHRHAPTSALHIVQAVALLPFIDEQRLVESAQTVRPTFTGEYACMCRFLASLSSRLVWPSAAEELLRDSVGEDVLFVSKSHPMFNTLCEMYSRVAGSLKKEVSELTEVRSYATRCGEGAPSPCSRARRVRRRRSSNSRPRSTRRRAAAALVGIALELPG
jgi:5'-3' exoribonuclease 2